MTPATVTPFWQSSVLRLHIYSGGTLNRSF